MSNTIEPSDKPKKRLRLPPELCDGDHTCTCDLRHANLPDSIADWFDGAEVGDSVTISVVEMTDEEFERLPTI